jgi:hypothetical protein
MSGIRTKILLAFAAAILVTSPAKSNNVLASIDFEDSTPGQVPTGVVTFGCCTIYGDPAAPSGLLLQAAQDGALFDDPIGAPGNISAVFDNNNHGFDRTGGTIDGPTNVHMAFDERVWVTDDPSKFTHGVVAYDIYLDPAPTGGLTFLENRLGFGPVGGSNGFISTVNDTTVRFSLGQNSGGDPFIRYDGFGNLPGSEVPLVGATNRVEINIFPNKTHTITLNGEVVEWTTPGGPVTALPWVDPAATGVYEMSFVGDFQGLPAQPHGLVWIDNIHVEKIPEPLSIALLVPACMFLLYLRRAEG